MTTRIWFENDALQMDGVGTLPARSLKTVVDGNRVHVLTLSDVRLSQLLFGEYATKTGATFASAAAVKTYLDAEFAKAVAGTPAWSDVTGKPTTFSPSAHSHSGLWQYIGDIVVTETLLVSLAVGMKRKTYPLAGVAVADRLGFTAAGVPTTGCEAVNVYPASAGNVSVGYYTPLLGIGATYSLPISVFRILP